MTKNKNKKKDLMENHGLMPIEEIPWLNSGSRPSSTSKQQPPAAPDGFPPASPDGLPVSPDGLPAATDGLPACRTTSPCEGDSEGILSNIVEVGNSSSTKPTSPKKKGIDDFCDVDESITLGDEDTIEVDNSSKELGRGKKQMEHGKNNAKSARQVFDKLSKKDGKSNTPWLDLFSNNRSSSSGLKLDQWSGEYSDGCLELEEEDIVKVEDSWGFGLVGYVAGKNPGKGAIVTCCNSWGVKYKLYFHESNWIIFKFESLDDRDKVLEKGPYLVYGRPLLLKVLTDTFAFDKE